jgi:uncharacterized protein (DUF736 family)
MNFILYKTDKTNDSQPDFKRLVEINGETIQVSAWLQKRRNGDTMLSIAIREPYKK